MLANVQPIQVGASASPGLWNERFAELQRVVNGNIEADNIKDGSITASKLSSDSFDSFYPVGSIYLNATVATNPASLLGFGTWEAFGTGRVLVGFDSTQTEFNAAEKTGGHKELQSHSHGVNDPSHSHTYIGPPGQTVLPIHGSGDAAHGFLDGALGRTTNPSGTGISIQNAGGGDAGNLQPFITVYMWKRIS